MKNRLLPSIIIKDEDENDNIFKNESENNENNSENEEDLYIFLILINSKFKIRIPDVEMFLKKPKINKNDLFWKTEKPKTPKQNTVYSPIKSFGGRKKFLSKTYKPNTSPLHGTINSKMLKTPGELERDFNSIIKI